MYKAAGKHHQRSWVLVFCHACSQSTDTHTRARGQDVSHPRHRVILPLLCAVSVPTIPCCSHQRHSSSSPHRWAPDAYSHTRLSIRDILCFSSPFERHWPSACQPGHPLGCPAWMAAAGRRNRAGTRRVVNSSREHRRAPIQTKSYH